MLLLIILAVIAIALIIWGIKEWLQYDYVAVRLAVGIVLLVACIAMFCCSVSNHVYATLSYASLQAEREAIVYQYEHDWYDSADTMMQKITRFNNKVLTGRAYQNSIWIGYNYNYIDWNTIDLIDYNK